MLSKDIRPCKLTPTFNHYISDIEHIWQTSWRLGFYRGGPVFMSALAGIDIALWDLKGMRCGTDFGAHEC
jgi:galactonate dehydratase